MVVENNTVKFNQVKKSFGVTENNSFRHQTVGSKLAEEKNKPSVNLNIDPRQKKPEIELININQNIDESNDFTDKKDKLFTKGANINIIENENKNMEAQDSTKFQVEYIDTIEPIKSGIVYKTSVSSSQNSEKKIEKAYSYKFTPTSKEKFKDYNENRYFFLNN